VQEEQAGTADAVNAARDHIEGPFAVLNGDNLYDQAAIDRLFDACPAVCAIEVDEPSNYGVLSTDGEDGLITEIVEKPADPPTNLANAGAYAFPEAREWLEVPASERGEHEITDVVARVIDEYDVTPITLERWLDVGRPWELLEANEWKLAEMERRIDGDVSEDATLEGAVVVEDGATIEPGVVIEGPALIREGAEIGPNAYVRGATLIGPDAEIGHSVEIKTASSRAERQSVTSPTSATASSAATSISVRGRTWRTSATTTPISGLRSRASASRRADESSASSPATRSKPGSTRVSHPD